jgi:hypothetical protein
MNPPKDSSPSPAENRLRDDPSSSADPQTSPGKWADALGALFTSRIGLVRIESQAAAKAAARKAIQLAVAAALLFFGWSLALAATVALISHLSGWPWHWVALAFAILHALVAFLLVRSAAAPGPPPFPITRAELQKDCEWIKNLKTKGKSNA